MIPPHPYTTPVDLAPVDCLSHNPVYSVPKTLRHLRAGGWDSSPTSCTATPRRWMVWNLKVQGPRALSWSSYSLWASRWDIHSIFIVALFVVFYRYNCSFYRCGSTFYCYCSPPPPSTPIPLITILTLLSSSPSSHPHPPHPLRWHPPGLCVTHGNKSETLVSTFCNRWVDKISF